jgi:enoyl-CoA hydratase/carnithine racemase
MAEMMLTRRIYRAEEALGLGLVHYAAAADAGLAKARELAATIAANTAAANWFITNALPRIDSMAAADGLFTESLAVSLIQTDAEAQQRMQAFLTRK